MHGKQAAEGRSRTTHLSTACAARCRDTQSVSVPFDLRVRCTTVATLAGAASQQEGLIASGHACIASEALHMRNQSSARSRSRSVRR